MNVCGPWPFNCLGCRHELFSYTSMSRKGSSYKCARSFWHRLIPFHIFPPSSSPRRMGLVWFLHLGDARKPRLLSNHCVPGPGGSNELSGIFPTILHPPSFTDDKRGSETKRHTNSKFMKLGFKLRALWGHPVLFPLHHGGKGDGSL